jgi:hypothetical protein
VQGHKCWEYFLTDIFAKTFLRGVEERIASTVHPQYRVPSLAEITISCIRRQSNERRFEMDDGGDAADEVDGSVCRGLR